MIIVKKKKKKKKKREKKKKKVNLIFLFFITIWPASRQLLSEIWFLYFNLLIGTLGAS